MMSLIHPSSSTAAPDTLARRIMQDAHLRDGLPEIVVGGILLLAAAQSYTMATLLHGGPLVLKRILILVWTFLVIALTFSTCSIPGAPGTGWLLRWLRRRYLISRYGYVKPRLEWNKRQLALYGGIGLLVVAALLIARREVAPPLLDRGLFIAIGVFVGGIEALVGRSLAVPGDGLVDHRLRHSGRLFAIIPGTALCRPLCVYRRHGARFWRHRAGPLPARKRGKRVK